MKTCDEIETKLEELVEAFVSHSNDLNKEPDPANPSQEYTTRLTSLLSAVFMLAWVLGQEKELNPFLRLIKVSAAVKFIEDQSHAMGIPD